MNDNPNIDAIKKALKKAAQEAARDPENQDLLKGKVAPNILANVPIVPGQVQLEKAQEMAIQENAAKKKARTTPGGSRSSSDHLPPKTQD
jgi:hypothetical protein